MGRERLLIYIVLLESFLSRCSILKLAAKTSFFFIIQGVSEQCKNIFAYVIT